MMYIPPPPVVLMPPPPPHIYPIPHYVPGHVLPIHQMPHVPAPPMAPHFPPPPPVHRVAVGMLRRAVCLQYMRDHLHVEFQRGIETKDLHLMLRKGTAIKVSYVATIASHVQRLSSKSVFGSLVCVICRGGPCKKTESAHLRRIAQG